MKLKLSKLTIVIICLLIITGVVFYYEEIKDHKEEKLSNSNIMKIDVIVLNQNIKENTLITMNMISVEKRYVLDTKKQTNIIHNVNEVVGMTSLVPMYKDEIIIKERLYKDDKKSDSNTTNVAINLYEVDKSLQLTDNDFIDIWIEPKFIDTQETSKEEKEAIKLFKQLKIQSTYDIDNNKQYDNVVIKLSDEQIKKLLEVDKNKFDIRVSKYNKALFYKNILNVNEGD